MTRETKSSKRDFIFCLLIVAAIYSCGTLMYYSQTFLSYNFYSKGMISEMLSGWNYLAQAAGIILYALLFRYFNQLSGRRSFQILISITLVPIISVSVFAKSSTVFVLMVFLLNLFIGLQTAFSFSLIASYVASNRFAICFAGAYSLGGIITYFISRLNESIMISFRVIIFACIFVGIASALMLLYKDIPSSNSNSENSVSFGHTWKTGNTVFYLIIALMAVIVALGTNDPILVESGSQVNFLVTRIFYAVGLILAAVIYDKNPTAGAICTLASILYPIMVIILYNELPINHIAVALTDTFIGFYAVYRAGTFISYSSKHNKLYMAALGLCASRIAEGITAVCIHAFGFERLASFILAGVLFVPLIILFCAVLLRAKGADVTPSVSVVPQSFEELYDLTRRESEIVNLLSQNKTNGEIADILCVSESTVRFHVSNILKKTGMKSRTAVGHAYKSNTL